MKIVQWRRPWRYHCSLFYDEGSTRICAHVAANRYTSNHLKEQRKAGCPICGETASSTFQRTFVTRYASSYCSSAKFIFHLVKSQKLQAWQYCQRADRCMTKQPQSCMATTNFSAACRRLCLHKRQKQILSIQLFRRHLIGRRLLTPEISQEASSFQLQDTTVTYRTL